MTTRDPDADRQVQSRSRVPQWARDPATLFAVGILLVLGTVAILADIVSPHAQREIVGAPLLPISSDFPLGTDEVGRDILSRLIYGSRVSIGIGFATATAALLVGAPWGIVAGYVGRSFDTISMRVIDGILAFPGILLALTIIAALGQSIVNLVLALAVSQIAQFARLMRGEVLSVREREFVKSARVIGASNARIISRAIVPSILPLALVQFSLSYASAVLNEAGLSFIGLGVQPPDASWGNMLSTAKAYLGSTWVYGIAPGVAIFMLVLALGLLGDLVTDRMERRTKA